MSTRSVAKVQETDPAHTSKQKTERSLWSMIGGVYAADRERGSEASLRPNRGAELPCYLGRWRGACTASNKAHSTLGLGTATAQLPSTGMTGPPTANNYRLCVSLLPFQGDSPVPRTGGSALHSPACTPSPSSRPPRPRPACVWPIQRGARATLPLRGLRCAPASATASSGVECVSIYAEPYK
jgi:hypothetical protein